MNFNHWDIILFIPLAWAAWRGFMKGFIIELAAIAALIAGLYVAANFSEVMAVQLTEWFEIQGTWLSFTSFLVTFLAVVVGVYALAKVLENAVNTASLKPMNKLGGALFGTVKMLLMLSIILNLLSWLDQHVPIVRKTSPKNSMLYQSVRSAGPLILPVVTHSEWMKKAEEIVEPVFSDSSSTLSAKDIEEDN